MPSAATDPVAPTRSVGAAPAVVCHGLRVTYGARVAVDGLSFTATHGEVLAILGPNGAGKTSTIETLEGYRRPSAGHVRVLGLEPITDAGALNERIGVMLQRGGIYPMLSARRVLALFAAYYARPVPPDELLALLALGPVADVAWRHLSGGEQQRVSLALALIGRPEVVFLDEPTSGVDPEGRVTIRSVLDDLRRNGVCVVLTTHELGEAERLADRVLIVDHGRVVAAGSPGELSGSLDATPSLRFGTDAGLDTAALAAVLGTPVATLGAGRYEIGGAASAELTAALATWLAERGHVLANLSTTKSLEDVYLALVGADETTAETPSRRRRRR